MKIDVFEMLEMICWIGGEKGADEMKLRVSKMNI
jgi:hypothetical protein